QKDYQQCMVIRKLLEVTGRSKDIKLEIVSTVREADGLAMSSRNLRLNKQQRQLANSIFKELNVIKENLYQYSLEELKEKANKHLAEDGFKVDYIEIANADDLSTASSTNGKLVALAAATTGNVRLIDNIVLN
ncbi:MAG: pantoate--beta-alanine ligase, partial [Flavisolibacter sp.]